MPGGFFGGEDEGLGVVILSNLFCISKSTLTDGSGWSLPY